MGNVVWAGRIVDSATGRLLDSMRVDLFERSNMAAIESTMTDSLGLFYFRLSDVHIQELLGDRPLNIFFQVFDRDTLLPSTEGHFSWVPGSGNRYLRIEAELPAKDKPMPHLAIGSLDEFISQQSEILERIAARRNGGHLFLLEPFELLAELGVKLAPEARQRFSVLIQAYPHCPERRMTC